MSQLAASIIISNTESKDLLPLHVHILCHQTFPRNLYEVILPLLEELPLEEETILLDFQTRYPHFKILPIEKNRAAALNTAVHSSKGKWLLFVESHCVMQDNWLETYISFLNKSSFECAVGSIQDLPSKHLLSFLENKIRMESKGMDAPGFLDLHQSAILRETFDQMGGFAKEMPILAGYELGARLHHQGKIIGRFIDQIVLHKNSTSLPIYLKTVGINGQDHMRVIFLRGNSFCSTYFPNPFIRLWKVIRPIRPLFVFAAHLLISFGRIGFLFCSVFNNKTLGRFFFRCTGKNIHRLGFLKAMKKNTYDAR